ncbi:MAG: 50S ribosomal protein L4 [Phycisphaerae bacterium]
MLTIPVYNEAGDKVGSEELDPKLLGGEPNLALLKQAVVMYRANRRQGTAATKSRGMIEGSTKKIYKQKGTGRARMGNSRQPVRRGGGHAFRKDPRDFGHAMPKKMKRLARNHAILVRLQGEGAGILDALSFDAPKTKRLATMFGKLGVTKGCVLATKGMDVNLYKSSRNLQTADVVDVAELNAESVLRRGRLLFTRDAFKAFKDGLAGTAKA